MKYLFISNYMPLKPLLDFNIGSLNVDLHNDYKCLRVEKKANNIEFIFKKLEGENQYPEENAMIIFSDIIESNYDISIRNDNIEPIHSLFNFARGELTSSNKYFSEKEIKYFFIGFENEELVNIFCKEAIIILW